MTESKSLRLTDRDRPYHFAGRDSELGILRERLDIVSTSGLSRAGLVLVTGVPGSGKTTLISEFMDSIAAGKMQAGVSQFSDPLRLFLAIGSGIGKNEEFKGIADIESRMKSGKIGVEPGSGAAEYEHVRATPDLEWMLQETTRKHLWKDGGAFVIATDELQNLTPEQGQNLSVLHEGVHGCPILVVGAGLENTRSVLSACGISRVTEGIELGPLSRDATREVIGESLAGMGCDAPSDVLEILTEASHGFPQHIHCYIASSLEVASDGNWDEPGVLNGVVNLGNFLRGRYYERRIQAMPGDGHSQMLPVIEHLVRSDMDSMPQVDAENAVSEAGVGDGEVVVESALKHGVLSKGDGGVVSFGIPSFRTHMEGILRQREALRHNSPGHGR